MVFKAIWKSHRFKVLRSIWAESCGGWIWSCCISYPKLWGPCCMHLSSCSRSLHRHSPTYFNFNKCLSHLFYFKHCHAFPPPLKLLFGAFKFEFNGNYIYWFWLTFRGLSWVMMINVIRVCHCALLPWEQIIRLLSLRSLSLMTLATSLCQNYAWVCQVWELAQLLVRGFIWVLLQWPITMSVMMILTSICILHRRKWENLKKNLETIFFFMVSIPFL